MATFVVRNDKGETHEVDEANIKDAESDGFNIVVSNGKEDHLVSYDSLGQAKKDGFWPTNKKTFLEKTLDAVEEASEFVNEGINRAGYGQIKNVAGLFTGLKDPTDPQSYSDAFFGTNAPTATDVFNSSPIPNAKIFGSANTENVSSLRTTPELSPEEQIELKKVDTGITTNDVAGFGADMAIGDGAFRAAGALLKTTKNAGPYLSKGVEAVADFIRPAKAKVNAQEIAEAAKRLNIKITPGMLDDSGFVERLENELSKSPSFLGQSIAKRQQAVTDALRSTVDDLTKEASSLSPRQLGEEVQEGIAANVKERLEPISKTFDDVRESTQHIPVGERPITAVVRNIENIPSYRLTQGAGKPSKYVEMLSRAENADDLKTIMTMLGKDLNNPALDSAEKFVLTEMKEKIARLESNSVFRAAIKQSKESTGKAGITARLTEDEAKGAAKEVVANLQNARTQYRDLSKGLSDVAKDSRIAKNTNPGGFVRKVEDLPPEKISEMLFRDNNQRLLDNLKQQFPREFELLRQGRIADIKSAATANTLAGQGKTSAQRFLNEINKINPEGQATIFGAEGVKKINDLRTVQQSIPRNFNNSNTASSLAWREAVWSNIKDIPTYILYKGASSNLANNIRSNLLKIPNILELSKANPKQFDSLVDSIAKVGGPLNALGSKSLAVPKVAEGGESNEATFKWIQNGIKKVSKAGSLNTDLDAIKNNPEISKLLVRAADMKEGSEGLKKIVEQIRNTEAFKKAPKGGPKTSNNYPMSLKKNGFKVTVFNDQDFYEARSEGWA